MLNPIQNIAIAPSWYRELDGNDYRMHAHLVSPHGQSTAHLDLWGIKARNDIDAAKTQMRGAERPQHLQHQKYPEPSGTRASCQEATTPRMRLT
jgi:hypothetical protein